MFKLDFDTHGSLFIDGLGIVTIPNNTFVRRNLYIQGKRVKKLPTGLRVAGDLTIENTSIIELPKCLVVKGTMYLRENKIENYPLVYGCGSYNRTIYLDLQDKTIIHIGCFKGTFEEAATALADKYSCCGRDKEWLEYYNKVKECFALWEKLK